MTQTTSTAPPTSTRQSVDYRSNNGKGGLFLVVEGEAEGFRDRVNKETGVQSTSGTVSYWGGSQFCRLLHPQQLTHIEPGSWVRLEGEAREFNGNTYAGAWRATHVNGKPLPMPKD